LKLLTEFPDRSCAEIKACMPVAEDGVAVANRTQATLDELVASGVVARRIDFYKAHRYSIKALDVNP
jgi:hypothetical protein